ncbi:MAG TPA: CHASE2 domain-containing protein, partial [bacterium]|nr:CHASE2 domain-containing protein [bacterium]
YRQGSLERLELVTYDWRLRITSPTTPRLLPFVVVGITENFQRKVGQDFSRKYFSHFLRICQQEGASVIGFDIFFPDLKEPGVDDELAKSLRSAGQTVLPVFSPEALKETTGGTLRVSSLRGSHTLFAQAATSSGHINVLPDSDRTIRRLPFLLQYGQRRIPQLSLEMVRLRSGQPEIRAQIAGFARPAGVVPLGPDGSFYLRFLKPTELAKYFHSFEDILLGNYPKTLFHGKIVLVGQTIVGAKNADLVPTPFGIQFGVMVQASALWTALSDAYIWRLNQTAILFLLLIAGFISGVVFFGRQPAASTLVLITLIVGLTWLSRFLLDRHGLFLEVVPFFVLTGACYVFSLAISLQSSLRTLFKKEAALSVLEETEREIAALLRPEELAVVSDAAEFPSFQTNQAIQETSEIALRTLLTSLGVESGAIIVFPSSGQPSVLVSYGEIWSTLRLERFPGTFSSRPGPIFLSGASLREWCGSAKVKQVMIITAVRHPAYRIVGVLVNKAPTIFSGSGRFTPEDARLAEMLLLQTLIAVQNARLTLALKDAQLETIFRLAVAVEYRDRETGLHIHRVSEYAGVMAEALKLPALEVELVKTAMPMHDIGKIAIPDHILLKAGILTEEERKVVHQHPVIGARMLKGSSSLVLKAAEVIALNHQERYDGSGYPAGLAGQAIPLYGRIAAIADIFGALSSKRIYKEAISLQESFQVIKKEAGHLVDPVMVEAFLRERDKIEEIHQRYLEREKQEDVFGPQL